MFDQLLSVFFESCCLLCDRQTGARHSLTVDYLCEFCDSRLLDLQLSTNERLKLYQAKSTFAWGRYDGLLKRAIALMKYEPQPKMARLLGTLLGKAWLDSGLTKQYAKVTVVPIPMHLQKQKLRGFNQAEIIARSFCQLTGYQLQTQILIRTRATAAMFDLKSIEERAQNLAGAIKVNPKQASSQLLKYPVLLIDDIHTTGTTVNEASRMLQHKNIQVIGVAVAAKAGFLT